MAGRLNLVVIGAGSGGYEAMIEDARKGAKVALVENRELGSTRLNRGCTPAKTILYTIDLYHELRAGSSIELAVSGAEVDINAARIRKGEVLEQLRKGTASLMRMNKISVYYGMGITIDRNMVKITVTEGEATEGPATLEMDHILITTGSVPACLPIPGSNLPGVVTSDGLLEKTDMLEHLIVIGGGVIGMEFASVHTAFGRKVTIIEALDRILLGMDKEIAQNLKVVPRKRGAEIHAGTKVESVQIAGDGPGLIYRYVEKEKPCEVRADGILIVTGGKVYTGGLITQESSHQIQAMAMERGRIVINEYYETGVPGIYGVGGVMGGVQLTHTATTQGRNAVSHTAGEIMEIRTEVVSSYICTSPKVRCVGINADEMKEQGRPAITKKYPVSANGESVLPQQKRGLIRVVADSESHGILDAQVVHIRATDMISQFGVAIINGLTLEDVVRTISPHPTFGEGILEAVWD